EADETATMRRHEVHRLGRRELGGDHEVAFVLTVRVVDDDDEPAGADVLDGLLDGGERRRHCHAHRLAQYRLAAGSRGPGPGPGGGPGYRATSRSTYFASTSVSRLTSAPGSRLPRVVTASVCGISATAKPLSSTAATVSDTPSTAIEPFSTM